MKNFLVKYIFFAATFCLTVFIFLNTYEVIANKDIPFATSLHKFALQDVINKEITEFSIKQDSRSLNNNSRLEDLSTLEIPSLDINLRLEESRNIKGIWYQRPSMGHYIGLNKDDYGNTVDYLIYTDTSWRTIPNIEDMEEGGAVWISNSRGVRVLFEISEKQILPFDKMFIINKSENRQIILIIEDAEQNRYVGYSLVIQR